MTGDGFNQFIVVMSGIISGNDPGFHSLAGTPLQSSGNCIAWCPYRALKAPALASLQQTGSDSTDGMFAAQPDFRKTLLTPVKTTWRSNRSIESTQFGYFNFGQHRFPIRALVQNTKTMFPSLKAHPLSRTGAPLVQCNLPTLTQIYVPYSTGLSSKFLKIS